MRLAHPILLPQLTGYNEKLPRIIAAAHLIGLALTLPVLGLNHHFLFAGIGLLLLGLTVAKLALWRQVNLSWLIIAEASIFAAALGISANQYLLPYLLVPLFLAGLTEKLIGLIRVILIILVIAAGTNLLLTNRSIPWSYLLAWLLLGTVIGLIATVLRDRILGTINATYRDAIMLIRQLNSLSDRLTGGLDPIAMSEELMTEADLNFPVKDAAVYATNPAGVSTPVRFSTFTSPETFADASRLVERAVKAGKPRIEGTRAAIPLGDSSSQVGALVMDLTTAPDYSSLAKLQNDFGEQSLMLRAALLFDEVRSQATHDERKRIAREVHDGVAQDVASLGYLIDALYPSANQDQVPYIKDLRKEVSRVVAELRASVYDLRTEMRAGQGLGQGVSEFARQIGSRSDLTVHVSLDESTERLRAEVEAELFRIAQEGMNNARKHSGGKNLWITLKVHPPNALIEVLDDGVGLRPGREDSQGLRIMRERAEKIGASIRLENLQGNPYGTKLTVTLGKG